MEDPRPLGGPDREPRTNAPASPGYQRPPSTPADPYYTERKGMSRLWYGLIALAVLSLLFFVMRPNKPSDIPPSMRATDGTTTTGSAITVDSMATDNARPMNAPDTAAKL